MNKIGNFPFVTMSQMPTGHRRQTIVEARSGVNGVFVWHDGFRDRPFQVVTVADAVNVADAQTAIVNYQSIIGALANVIFANVLRPNQVCVLDVVPMPNQIRQTLLGIGGLYGTSNGIVAAQWTLVTTDIAAA